MRKSSQVEHHKAGGEDMQSCNLEKDADKY